MSGRVRELSRRRFLVGASATAGAAILAACGGSSSATDTPAATKPATAASAPVAPTTAAAASSVTGTTAASAPSVVASPAAASPAASAAVTGSPTKAVASAASANVPKGGTLTQTSIATDAKSFHPYLTTDTGSSGYQSYIYGGTGLTKYDPDTLDQTGFAATKWDLSVDKKTYTFTLRDDLKWSDGAPITTADYVWTYQQAIKPENKFPYLENLTKIASYEAKDAKTLVVTMKEASTVNLDTANSITVLPKHIWEKYDWSDPTKNPEINAPTVGCGIWKLKEWKRDDHATFVANDLYWEGRPNIDSTVVRIFGTVALAFQALKSGEVDYSSFQASDYAEAKKLANVTVYEWYTARGTWGYMGFNLRKPALKDPLVRKALAYASDRKGIIDGVIFGLARPTYGNLPQSSWAYNPSIEHYDFDTKKSADLLKQAGYTLNGKKLTKDGQALSLKLVYPTSSKTREGIATVTQQQLGDLGIAVDVQGLEFQAYSDVIQTEPGDWDLQLGAWSSTINPYFGYQLWAASSIPKLNFGAYMNKQVEDLYSQAYTEFDRDKQKAIYGQIQKILTDDEPYAFLYEALVYAGVNKRVGGITATRLGIEYNLDKWYITK